MTMFLLPPSETKNDAKGKAKLNLTNLSNPELNESRQLLIESLMQICGNNPTKARSILGLSQKLDFERNRNTVLKSAPISPAWQIYSGVLFDAINPFALSAAAIKKLEKYFFVQSALFGLISLGDQIPAYRLSADSKLPKIGSLSNVWAKPCTEIFENNYELIVDLRSSQYVSLAPLPKTVADQVVVVKILQKMPSGPPRVVSHHNKATKGRIVRQIVTSGSIPNSVDQLSKSISKLKADVEVIKPKRASQTMTLNVVVAVP